MGETRNTFQYMTDELYQQASQNLKAHHYQLLFIKLFSCGEGLEARGQIEAAQEIAKAIQEFLSVTKQYQLKRDGGNIDD